MSWKNTSRNNRFIFAAKIEIEFLNLQTQISLEKIHLGFLFHIVSFDRQGLLSACLVDFHFRVNLNEN